MSVPDDDMRAISGRGRCQAMLGRAAHAFVVVNEPAKHVVATGHRQMLGLHASFGYGKVQTAMRASSVVAANPAA